VKESSADRLRRVDELRHALLQLHKGMIDAQRILYERGHGRVETTSQFLGLVLEHPEFEWIRELSALIAQLDEWREAPDESSDRELDEILGALRGLIQPGGSNEAFTRRYWQMLDTTPEVLVDHVKLWRLL
jgi:hypothetical protein